MQQQEKPKKRRRRSDPNDPEAEKRRKARHYFNDRTQAAIIEHLRLKREGEHVEADRLYRAEVYPAMHRLVEALINVYRFSNDGPTRDLLESGVTFLTESLHKFDPTRGTPAFSYFNMVARNFLINEARRAKEFAKRHGISLSRDRDDQPMAIRNLTAPQSTSRLDVEQSNLERDMMMNDVHEQLHDTARMDAETLELFERFREMLVDPPDEIDGLTPLFIKRFIYARLGEQLGLSEKEVVAKVGQLRRAYGAVKGQS